MFLAKVKGNIISTHKNKHLVGHKLLITHPIDIKGKFSSNKDIISLDILDAGVGDTVLLVQEGDAVQQILGNTDTPINTMTIAIVDNIDIEE